MIQTLDTNFEIAAQFEHEKDTILAMPILETNDPEIRALTGIHVYHYFLSNCAQRVCIAVEDKGQEWTPHAISLFRGQNIKDDYLRINPKGLIPALVHDGVVITESIDILRYLEERFPEPALYPRDPEARREVDGWMNIATDNHVGVIKTYMYATVFGSSKKPEDMQHYREIQEDSELVAFHQEALDGFTQDKTLAAEREVFGFFDRMEKALGQHRWLVGDDFSHADISWFVQYYLMTSLGAVNFERYPNIRRWGNAIMQRPSYQRGIKAIQPWYAPAMRGALRLKSTLRRKGLAPKAPRHRDGAALPA